MNCARPAFVGCLIIVGSCGWIVASSSVVSAQTPETAAAESAPAPESVESQPVSATEPPTIEPTTVEPELADGLVRFSFNGAPWRDVINWIADESNLALHVGELPPGSFTYSDP